MLETIFYMSVIGYCIYSLIFFTYLFIEEIFKNKRRKNRQLKREERQLKRHQLFDEIYSEQFQEWKRYKNDYEHAKSTGNLNYFTDRILKDSSDLRNIMSFENRKHIVIKSEAPNEFYILISNDILGKRKNDNDI